MKYFLLILFFIPTVSIACDKSAPAKLWYFRTFDKTNLEKVYSADNGSGKVIIETAFLDRLIKIPNIKEFDRNRYELYYLLAKGSYKAELAGLKALAHILLNPEYVVECEQKVHVYNTAEIAINLSRSNHLFKAYCNLTKNEQQTVSKYYINNPNLYQVDVDAPWDFDACK